MFKNFLAGLKPIKIEDPYFGPLLYMKAARGHSSYWEGALNLEPLHKRIEVYIDAPSPEEPTSQAQRDFFRWVERDYSSICSIVEERFRAEPWAQQLVSGRFEDAFCISSLSIPLCRAPGEEWSIVFEAAADEDHIFTVHFQDREVLSVSIDG